MISPDVQQAFRALGIEPTTDRDSIRAAWRRLVRAYHPDQVQGDKDEANRRLAELNAAFDLVSAWRPIPQPVAEPPKETAGDQRRQQAEAAAARARAAELDRIEARLRAERAARRTASRPARPITPAEARAARAAHALFQTAREVLCDRDAPRLRRSA